MLLRKPPDDLIRRLIVAQGRLPLSYGEVGATRQRLAPAGYPINQYRGRVGEGREAFGAAVAALSSWEMYSLGWTKLCWPTVAPREGEVVVVLARAYGLWTVNPCRVVYTLEEEEKGQRRRHGFAIGTLPGHVEQGEERFTVEWDQESGAVWYELFAFARAGRWLARLGYPFMRAIQGRFAAESCEAMRMAVKRRLAL
jgi:uncharacterized protein (UPF0548 family)